MYTNPLAFNMAKLYWRIKKEGKWTWIAADEGNSLVVPGITRISSILYREESP